MKIVTDVSKIGLVRSHHFDLVVDTRQLLEKTQIQNNVLLVIVGMLIWV